MNDLTKVTRVTIVGPEGVEFEKRGIYNGGCFLSIQDGGKTLKIFPSRNIEPPKESNPLRDRLEGALQLVKTAALVVLNDSAAKRFVHVVNLGAAAYEQERLVSPAWF